MLRIAKILAILYDIFWYTGWGMKFIYYNGHILNKMIVLRILHLISQLFGLKLLVPEKVSQSKWSV